MQTIILAAGYATRLYPLTKDRPKPLLPVAGKPIMDYILEKLDQLPEQGKTYVVTNAKFHPHFEAWKQENHPERDIVVLNDGTDSDETKLGAIGDIRFVLDNSDITDDLLIVAGDNIFDFDLRGFHDLYKAKGPAVGLYQTETLEDVKKYNCIELDSDRRITSFVEKPENPTTTNFAIALYYYNKQAIELMQKYLAEGGNPDAPGYYVQWLYQQMPVYGYTFSDAWFDIGNIDAYNEAQAFFEQTVK